MPGINAPNRMLLTTLHRRFTRPFSVVEASEALAVTRERARKLLGHLASRGWLARVKRGTYSTVPLDATQPQEWRADPCVTAAVTFGPCYLGGWTAAEHWEPNRTTVPGHYCRHTTAGSTSHHRDPAEPLSREGHLPRENVWDETGLAGAESRRSIRPDTNSCGYPR